MPGAGQLDVARARHFLVHVPHRGGLRAEILSDGIIKVGDIVTELKAHGNYTGK